MASCSTPRWVTYAPYTTLTVNIASQTGDTVTFNWSLTYYSPSAASTNGIGRAYWVSIDGNVVTNGSYNIHGVVGTTTIASGQYAVPKGTSARNVSFSTSFNFDLTWSGVYAGVKDAVGSIQIAAKESHTVSYNANGGSGAPSAQTKWYGTILTLSSKIPTRTGYSFKGWATSSGGSVAYTAGGKYGLDQDITLYAVWQANTYTVKYNANGGSGAPGNQTKTYGVTLKLSSTVPKRTNYTFKGWSTSANGSVVYAAGANYTANAAVTLYAVWELAYTAPRITNLSADRCNSSGTLTDEGTYAKVTCKWATDKTVSSVKIEWKLSTSTTWSKVNVTATGTSGSVNYVVGSGGLSTENTYDLRVTVTDSLGSSTSAVSIAPMAYVIDFRNGGKGIGIGGPADANYMHVYMQAKFDNYVNFVGNADHAGVESFNGATYFNQPIRMNAGFWGPSIPANSNLNNYTTPGFYYCPRNVDVATMSNCPTTNAFCLEVFQHAGTCQRLTEFLASNIIRIYIRNLYNGTWSSWSRIITNDSDTNLTINNVVLRNNKSLSIKKTDGTNEEIFAVNASNGTRMGWTSGGLMGRVRKTIWSGSWGSGTITVSEHMYYNIFLIFLDQVQAPAVCIRQNRGASNAYIMGGGISPDPTLIDNIYASTVLLQSVNTTQLTHKRSKVLQLDNASFYEDNRNIIRIEGVM